MKRLRVILATLLLCAVALVIAGCGNTGAESEDSLVGVWEYADEESDMGAIYDFHDDGTGTYTLKVGEQEVVYEIAYETKDGHLLVTYVNSDVFSEEDVLDNEFSFQDANTIVVKDSFGEELTFVRK